MVRGKIVKSIISDKMDRCLINFYDWILQGAASLTLEEKSQHIDSFDGSINRNDWLRRSLSFYKDGCLFIKQEQVNISMCLALYLKDNYIGRVIPNRLCTSVIHKVTPPEFVLFRGNFLQKYHEEALIRCDNLCTFYDCNVFFSEFKLDDRQYTRIIHFVDTAMS